MAHAVELGGLRLSVIDQGDGTYALAAQNLNTGASPSNSVVAETTAGASSSAGNAATYSRGNHTHGTPGTPTTISQGGGSVAVGANGAVDITIPSGASDDGEYALDIRSGDAGRIRFLASGDVRIDGANNAYVNINADNTVELSSGATTVDLTPDGDVVIALDTARNVIVTGLPTSAPPVAGALWCDTAAGRVLKVSAGA